MDFGLKNGEKYWKEQSLIDAKNNRDRRHQHGKGPCNIFILDTSSSLGDEGFIQMKETFYTIINGYADHPDEDENVAVIVCGKCTRFQHYFSNQYSDLIKCLENVECEGLSPLTAAFLLCIESTNDEASHALKMGDFNVRPRIILISDGRPTDFYIMSDENDSSFNETDQAKDHLHQVVRRVGRRSPVFCIPIGKNPDMIYLEFLCALSRGGKIVHPYEARQFARYSRNLRAASVISSSNKQPLTDKGLLLSELSFKCPGKIFTEMDQEDIFEICMKKSLYKTEPLHSDDSDSSDSDYEKRDPCMPELGSRVKRGPDWKWRDQDSYGPGTVTKYSKRTGWLKVEWDNGVRKIYRYGTTSIERDIYDVIVCEIPRVLEEGEIIGTGCLVVRGPDWKWGNQDGGEGNMGSVYKVRRNGSVKVRWSNGNKKEYRFGYDGKLDLQICDPFSKEVREYLLKASRDAFSMIRTGSFPNSRELCFRKEEPNSNIDSKYESMGFEQLGIDCPPESPTRLLKVPKGKYFKNDKPEREFSSDVKIDGPKALNQWMWKDNNGKWNPYPEKMNDKIWKSWKKNPNSTVLVEINDCVCRVVLGKNIQINVVTRETMEVKLLTDFNENACAS